MATREYGLMRKTFVCFPILFAAAVPVHGQAVELTLHPVKVDEAAQTYRLLVKPTSSSTATPYHCMRKRSN